MSFIENFKKTLKSSETEDWLDYRLIRPLSYLCACVFEKLGTHPNTVTIISMIVGAGSTYYFASGSYFYEGTHGLYMNIIAVLLLWIADILDCTDGQLARMTGKKSRMGRILDGAAGFVWFVPVYLGIVYRFYNHHAIEFQWLCLEDTQETTLIATGIVFVMALISGFLGMGGQQRLADYYIQIHLFFLKGEKGSELDSSEKQQAILDQTPVEGNRLWRGFLKNYISYTKKQEASTPQFQQFMAALRQKYGTEGNMPEDIRREFHAYSKSLMGWNACLTFNFRCGIFMLLCLADIPVVNFIFEIVFMSLLTAWINHRHEGYCMKMTEKVLGSSNK